MFTLATDSLQKIAPTQSISEQESEALQQKLPSFIERIYNRNVGFHECIDDERLITEIEQYAHSVEKKYTDIVVLGIGGSALGARAIAQSLLPLQEKKSSLSPTLHVIDNIDPLFIRETEDTLTLAKTLFLVITKSGTTPETMAQYLYFRKKIEGAHLSVKNHFVFITDKKNGLLRKIANDEDIRAFPIPENVGGRFSVLTAVGLLPACLVGSDIRSMISGSREMRDLIFSDVPQQNSAFTLAKLQYLYYKNGKPIHVLFPYSQKLTGFAEWWKQLTAESLGKAKNERGDIVNVGITPTNALGATDQHSQCQLYNEGPNDKFFLFVEVEDMGAPLHIPKPENEDLMYLANISFETLLKTEKEGTMCSLMENNRPCISLTFPSLNARTLGALFMLFEGVTAFLGEFLEINAYDQPGVERGKVLTKEMLSLSSHT